MSIKIQRILLIYSSFCHQKCSGSSDSRMKKVWGGHCGAREKVGGAT